jgi:SAM-dependent methyltransferase
MSSTFAAVNGLLFCPDDGAPLRNHSDYLLCAACSRRFAILEGTVVDLRPAKPAALPDGLTSEGYRRGYLEEFARPLRLKADAVGWGAPEYVPAAWTQRRDRQRRQGLPLLACQVPPSRLVLCDLAAGAGFYSLEYARMFRIVLHCDLAADAISYAWHKARAASLGNMLFICLDYLQPPFRASLDRILCLDTLIRGKAHEQQLLGAIRQSLSPNGLALVDFHNWWHNPLRRVGLLPENYCGNQSYSRAGAEALLRRAGIRHFGYVPFRQEADPGGVVGTLSRLLPPTRLMYRFGGGLAAHPQSRWIQNSPIRQVSLLC